MKIVRAVLPLGVLLCGLSIAAADIGAEEHFIEIPLTYFGEIGCAHCDTFVEKDLPELTADYGVTFKVELRDILTAEGYEACRERLAEMGREFRVFPVLFVGNNAYQGNSAIESGLDAEIRHVRETGEFRPQVPSGLDGSRSSDRFRTLLSDSLPLIPIFLAGMADGINPCAFTTMLFLISLLTMFGRGKAEILSIGLIYAATIFATYFTLGLGLLTVLRNAMDVSILRIVLRIAVSSSALVFAVFSARDAVLMKKGRSGEAVLQLGARTKRKIHGVMRSGAGRGGIVLGTMGAAFLVSLLELACTGQLYFPTIAYLVQTGSTEGKELLALGLYNVAFILPLLMLFGAVFVGVRSPVANRWFREHAGAAKMLTAAALLLLAGAVWVV